MSRKTTFIFNKTINERFKELVEERHMKQVDVAVALDTTPTNVSRWMNCKNGIGEPFFTRICDYFGVYSSWLRGETNNRRNECLSVGIVTENSMNPM